MKTMEDEFFSQNSELSIEFSKYVLEHPELDDMLEKNATIIFLPEFAPQLKKFNIEIARELEKEQTQVMYVTVQKITTRPISRLDGVVLRKTLGENLKTANI